MFRFTIRDLLWLMVVVGLAVGWWTERRQLRMQLMDERESRSEWIDQNRELRMAIYKITGKLPMSGYKASTGEPTYSPPPDP